MTYTGLTDFYFECTIQYRRVTTDDGARFDVVLTIDGEVDESTVKTTTSLEKTVVFTSADFRGRFGKTVRRTVHHSSQCYSRKHFVLSDLTSISTVLMVAVHLL